MDYSFLVCFLCVQYNVSVVFGSPIYTLDLSFYLIRTVILFFLNNYFFIDLPIYIIQTVIYFRLNCHSILHKMSF